MRSPLWVLYSITLTAAAQRIDVALCNLATVPSSVVARAKSEASYLFQSSGVEVVWAACGENGLHGRRGTDARFVIRLRPNSGSAKGAVLGLEEMIGRAFLSHNMPPVAAGTYRYADVYYAAAAKLARSHPDADEGQILGCAIAHEIGHLLLGARHTPGSLMAASWRAAEVEAIRKRALRFDKKVRAIIAKDLRELHRQELALATPEGPPCHGRPLTYAWSAAPPPRQSTPPRHDAESRRRP